MRLSAIRLAGFKSFVDRTQLDLTSNLTAVVGPNGCGKSNLIDAVRWVLGESSAKQLRGEALADVIFNGSKTRKPVGRAMIELVFDNSDASIEGPYAQYGEIAVRRELSRDGGSQFFINGTRCRRKDVTELFLGTGLGVRSNYAIIEQGTVSRLIEAQPEELRQMLEESAGISRYKEKRRETEIRIRHTRENLERLEDLLGEIDERLAKLQRQAKAAQRFKRYKQEQRQLRRQLLGLRWRELEGEHGALREQLAELQAHCDQANAGLKQAMARRNDCNAAAERAVEATQNVQGRYYAAEAQSGRSQQELKHARDMAELREREADELRREGERLAQQQEQRTDQAARVAAQLEKLQTSLTAAREELDALDEGFTASETRAREADESLAALRRELQQPRTAAATEQVRLEQLGRQLERNEQRERQCREELQGIDLSALDEQLAAAAQALEAGEAARDAADRQASAAIRAVADARAARSEADSELHECRQQAQEVHARLAALSAEQSRALGEDEQDDQDWLARNGAAQAPPLGRLLQVGERWATAVEAVLGPWLKAPCLEPALDGIPTDDDSPLRLIGGLDDDFSPPSGSLAAEVDGPPAVRRMLASVRVAEDQAAAAALVREAPAGTVAVTPDGLMHWSGARQRPEGAAEQGVLLRERLLEELRAQHGAAQRAVDEAAARQQAAVEALGAAETAQQDALKALDVARRQYAEAQGAREQLLERRRVLEQRQTERQGELEEIRRLQAELASERERAQALLDDSRAEVARLERQEQAQQARTDAARTEVQALRQRREKLQRQLEDERERRAALATELAASEAARDGLSARRQELAATLEATQRQREDSGSPLTQLEAAVTAAQKHQTQQAEALKAARQAQEQATAEAHRAAQAVLEQEQAVQQAREALQQQQFAEQRLLARRDALGEQLREAGAKIDDILAELDPELSAEACETELAALEQRIQRLGAVNLAAVEEYDEEKARADQLRAQEADLSEALATLEDAIRQIDKETRSRFRTTFDAVNENFQARFPRLFGGGEAYLELSGDDLLEAGVRVMARPPGKRNATIQLLSGGEKALTAVALVFALFELNPAPFCMLDEVDAPLDDANVVRFCDVVREMSDRIQFILVTHNKVTMELADQLNGVTMQEAGVSRLVSVDVQQAVAMAG